MKNLFKIKLASLLLIVFQSCTKEEISEVEAEQVISVISEGNRIVREILGDDIGQMQFDTKEANEFRLFVTNSLVFQVTSERNTGFGSSDLNEFREQFQFCEDGSFSYKSSGFLTINTENGGSQVSETSNSYSGYWEAAALPDNLRIIVMYGTDPNMLEEFPNGLIPFFIANHGVDFVALPSGDLYNRTPNQPCN
jgi:hypothetical protein